ncbi:sensor histidine kinase [Hominifimenecus sp. rT4P-3]|uniref:sensor histidine kinase n=1 Tax=Hominifimenecus sp. rT4P-3 TaxID=3242979 RepID=UPI003DA602BE
MERLIDKCILLILGLLILQKQGIPAQLIPIFLIVVAVVSLEEILPEFPAAVLCSFACLLFCITPFGLYFLPVLVYCCQKRKKPIFRFIWLLPLICLFMERISASEIACLFLSFLSILLAQRTEKLQGLRIQFHQMQDLTKEKELSLKHKNQELLEKQDYEIRLATLSERNRIAREIHDNVGHLLTRALLQTGALEVIYKKNAELTEQLSAVKSTLSDAMDHIRRSVHGLHDEAFDLRTQIETLIRDFPFCPVSLEYSARQLPQEVQHCLVAIIKEALSNIARHSNASLASIRLLEHPAFYQLIIQDNGTIKNASSSQGIGLSNIRERVEAFHGIFETESSHGFRLFISIPKNRRDYENHHH